MTFNPYSNQIRAYHDAIVEAERFIKRAKTAMDELSEIKSCCSKANATAKRASMDLTNALVQVRK